MFWFAVVVLVLSIIGWASSYVIAQVTPTFIGVGYLVAIACMLTGAWLVRGKS